MSSFKHKESKIH